MRFFIDATMKTNMLHILRVYQSKAITMQLPSNPFSKLQNNQIFILKVHIADAVIEGLQKEFLVLDISFRFTA